jgi:phosphoglycolate phosphatase
MRQLAEPRLRLVIFDFDGTLADSFAWLTGALNEAAARHRFRTVTAGDAARLRGLGAGEVLRDRGVPGWKVPLIAADLRRRMGRDIAQIRCFDGVETMLSALDRAGLRIGIVTSNSASNVHRVLGPAASSTIRHLVCGVSLHGKRTSLRRLLRAARIGAADAVYLGDELRDIDAARGVGAVPGAVAWGYNRIDALCRREPALVFHEVSEIAPRLIGR